MSGRGRAGVAGGAASLPGSGERAARRRGRRPRADVAVVLAIVVPGLGHLHAGRPRAAALWLLAILAGYWAFYWAGLALHALSLVAAARVCGGWGAAARRAEIAGRGGESREGPGA